MALDDAPDIEIELVFPTVTLPAVPLTAKLRAKMPVEASCNVVIAPEFVTDTSEAEPIFPLPA